MSKKVWIIFIAVVVIVFGAMIYFSGQSRLDVSGIDQSKPISASDLNGQIGDHVFGNKDSKVVLVEYGDFQCPGCGSAYPQIKVLTEKYEDEIAFVFRNFPLTTIHPNARVAAAAAEAAGKQDAYWKMHDLIFTNQSAWSDLAVNERTDFFENLANQLGLDLDKFRQDLVSESISQKIAFDLALGKQAGATSTPTFYLNGENVPQETWGDNEALEKAIRDLLTENGVDLPSEDADEEPAESAE